MASQSLYRKWRSQTFSDMVGQEPVIRTLKNALHSRNLAHAYLFTGPRGTGKTSTARLLAKTINCLNPRDGEPCNECLQCREITVGNSFNVIEIDAASNRGIDSIRELREKVMVPPSSGKYKVYILDEAHMLTTEAFNALLKTLEEPPPHAIFVMATTDVHKMLPTVLSRCQRFDFKRFTLRQLVERLHYVAEQEQIKLEGEAAELIARAATGGMRDALSLLDQAIAYSGQEITLSQVQAMLGVADPRAIQKFVFTIAQLDSSAGLHLIHELVEAGADLRQLNAQIAEYWRAMMLAKAGANIAEILDSTDSEIREISEVAKLFALEELIECARVFAQNDLVQKNQGTPQLGLELALLTCIELHRRGQTGQALRESTATTATPSAQPRSSTATPAQRPATAPIPLRAQPTPPPVSNPDMPVSQPPQAPVVTSPAFVAQEPAHQEEALPDWDDLKENDAEGNASPVTSNIVSILPSVPNSPTEKPVPAASAQSASNAPTLTVAQVREKWEYVKRRVKTKKDGPKVAAFLNGYTIVDVDCHTDVPVIAIRASATFHYNALQKGEYHGVIEWAFKVELGQECRVRLLPPGQSSGVIHSTAVPPLSPPPFSLSALPHEGDPRSANTAPPAAYRQPTHVEKPPTALHKATAPVQVKQAEAVTDEVQPPPPLARLSVVRENTNAVPSTDDKSVRSGETRQVMAEKKAKSDPVVREVVRMFKAEIKEVQLK